jgi:hypothetical protein
MMKAWTDLMMLRFLMMLMTVGCLSQVHATPKESAGSRDVKEATESTYQEPNPEGRCTYRSYQWSTRLKRAVNRVKVNKKRSELTAEERDPDFPQCTVCREDQEEIKVRGIPSVTVCKHFALQVREALDKLAQERRANSKGFRVVSLIGYRVGKTRGRLHKGVRMDFSNHSYGTAIDINAKSNGLYRPCSPKNITSFQDVKRCKLRHGGHWKPKQIPSLSISRESKVYEYFTGFWKWGGERKDRVRDFMHFSPTGL